MGRLTIPDKLIELVREADSITVLTGAGVSAESGIPTFRDPKNGLFTNVNIEDLATPQGFRKDPKKVWEWYQMRREKVKLAKPNPGHLALVEMENRVRDFTLITQNVDGLHRIAGNKKIIELHGNIMKNKCFDCNQAVEEYESRGSIPPQCPYCGGLIRPAVVWFGEMLDEADIAEAESATRRCKIFFSIGTSSVVYPAAGLITIARHSGATVVEVNPNETPHSRYVDYVFRYPAGVFLPELVKAVWGT